MEQHYIIEFDGQGQFKKPDDKMFIIDENTKVLFLYSAKQNKTRIPVILTNFQNDGKRTMISDTDRLPKSLDKLFEDYNCFEGNYEMNLNWTCLCHFDKPGLYTFQIVFYKEIEEIHKSKTSHALESHTNGYSAHNSPKVFSLKLKISEKIEYVVVSPHYRNPMKKEVDIKKFNFLNLITLYPTMLGKIEYWKYEFESLIDRGYKGFHLCPIQELGISKSLYCLKAHDRPNPDIFPDDDYTSLKALFDYLRSKHNVFFLTDIILNHCAVNAQWIIKSPEAYFSPKNTPNLTIAYILDKSLFELASNFKKINITDNGLIRSFQDIDKTLNYIRNEIINKLKIEEYFQLDVEKTVSGVISALKEELGIYHDEELESNLISINFIEKSDYDKIKDQLIDLGKKPYGVHIDHNWLANFLQDKMFKLNIYEIAKIVKDINQYYSELVRGWKEEIIKAAREEMEYRFLKLKNTIVNDQYPLISRYFHELPNGDAAALNGWIMNYNSNEDFTTSREQHYLRRHIVVWGDLIKLRYENVNCEVWNYMERYVVQMANLFDGFRLDNFHSTKLTAAQYLIKAAMKANPNLYIISELFIPSSQIETQLCAKVGIHRLIREIQNCYSASDLFEMFKHYSRDTNSFIASIPALTHTTHEISYLHPKSVHTVIYDQTHDNPTFYQKFGIHIQLPITALLNFYNRMVGTTKGFDEMYMKHLPVTYDKPYPKVSAKITQIDKTSFNVLFLISKKDMKKFKGEVHSVELRGSFNNWQQSIFLNKDSYGDYWCRLELAKGAYEYKFVVNGYHWTINKHMEVAVSKSDIINNVMLVDRKVYRHTNLSNIRAYFNKLHEYFSIKDAKINMEKHGEDFIMIKRFMPDFKRCYVLVTRLCYDNKKPPASAEFVLPGWLHNIKKLYYSDREYEIIENEDIPLIKASIIEEDSLSKFGAITHDNKKLNDVLKLKDIPPNFVLILKTYYPDSILKVLSELNTRLSISVEEFRKDYLWNMEIRDINYYLYVCDREEVEIYKSGNYVIPNYGQLPFAGFAGLAYLLRTTSLKMDYEHVIYKHIMEGDYLIDYYMTRLERYRPNCHYQFKDFYRKVIVKMKMIPRFLIPALFHKFISLIISSFEAQFLQIVVTPDFFKNNNLYRILLLALPQFMTSENGSLYLLSAGLPHFTCGVWKNWGRDTFISFKGVFIVTGLHKYGKEIILHYASYMRHGLIPNMLDPSRYNSRDATWWFIKAVKDYVETTGDFKILDKNISMKYLDDNKEKHEELMNKRVTVKKSLMEIIQEIFQKHAQGINFVEWNAPDIDSNMSYNGFHVSLYTNWKTGFIMGGNNSNCLTWMDKMGSSKKAGNYSIPATPRIGAPIELTSLLYIGLKFMCMLYNEGYNNSKGIDTGKFCYSYNDWKKLVARNFEVYFWIPESEDDFHKYKIESEFVTTKGIFKDTYSQTKKDYKLRPNALIAMALTPKLFAPDHIKYYLQKVQENLIVN